MAMLPCDWCKKFGHAWFDCPDSTRPAAWRPSRLTKSAAMPIDTLAAGLRAGEAKKVSPAKALSKAEADAAHLAPKKAGRPKSIVDVKAYRAAKARERRAQAK